MNDMNEELVSMLTEADLARIIKRDYIEPAMQARSDAAWAEFNEEVEKWNDRELAKERKFWKEHTIIKASELSRNDVIVERRNKKIYRTKVRRITAFGTRDRYRRVEVYGIRTLWSYHVEDDVVIAL